MAETTRMQLVDWLDDLTVRFLLNLPASELSSVPRLCFQVEEAQWYYEDFIRPAAAAASKPLPQLQLRQFCLLLFQHCPLLSGFSDAQHIAAYEEFLAYKVRVPVRGAILMDQNMEKLVLVKGWKKSASWSFPRGKINKDEPDLDCAIREVWEETGFDVQEAGLVPANRDVKYIDITMREQHMRLFVFRGVREDTFFEPKTRKEISKIQWYNVRDLPGFKKLKQGADQAANANKFYMVAPFLGPLKKWINQQRRQDTSTMPNGSGAAVIEDEGMMTDQYYGGQSDFAGPDKSADLMGLLNIGRPAPAQEMPLQQSTSHPQNLLSLLQGGSPAPPQAQFEQFGGYQQQQQQQAPSQHQQHPSMGYNGPPQQFHDQNPAMHQQQQRSFTQPPPGMFGPGPNAFQQQQQGGQQFPGGMPPQMQPQQFHQGPPQQGSQFGNTNGVPFGMPQRQPEQPPQMTPQGMQQPQNLASMPQGPNGPMGAGPAVPSAEHLPMPKLNAHSASLLSAFKSGNDTVVRHPPGGRPGGNRQNSLLDLFRKPSASDQPPMPTQGQSPVPAASGPQRPEQPQRRPTLNEITRTLPKSGVKSPVKSKATPLPTQNAPAPGPPAQEPVNQSQRPAPRHAKAEPTPAEAGSSSPMTILQRPQSRHTSQSPKPQPQAPKVPQNKPSNSSKKQQAAAKGAENGQPAPQFTILPRPGSAKSNQSPASPLRNATPAGYQQQVHVLKRNEPSHTQAPQPAAEGPQASNETGQPEQQRDQLLSLFGKSPAATAPQSPMAPVSPAAQSETSQSKLLGLFNGSQPAATTPRESPAPPPAPLLVPERRPSHQASLKTPPNGTTQQGALLDLFNKASGNPQPAVTPRTLSPGTPISPFALGTPVNRNGPANAFQNQQQYQQTVRRTPAPLGPVLNETDVPTLMEPSYKQRINSMASNSSAGGSVPPISRTGSSGGNNTPTSEASKGFLLNFLNGVVKKEGQKGPRNH